MKIFNEVKEHYTLPSFIEERDFQLQTMDLLAELPRAGIYLGVGTGKTFVSTMAALWKRQYSGSILTLVIMPPVLIPQWYRWLNLIKPKDGKPLKVCMYRGTPKHRATLDILKFDFVLMSIQVFKNDFDAIDKKVRKLKSTLIIDEATNCKSVASQNYRTVQKYITSNLVELMLLTGTPLTTPMDGYAFIKLIAPSIYKNLRQFENIHVASRDFFNKITGWQNLPLLSDNLKVNSVRIQRREVFTDLKPVFFDPVDYDLEPAHLKLYRKLVDEQILELPDGGKIDATQQSALYHKLQQIVCNWDYFSGEPDKQSAGFDIVDSMLSELDGQKLVIIGNYKLTNAKLLERLQKYNAVAAYGAISSTQQEANIQRFIDDPDCRVFILQPSSAGFGLDGLQHVCSNMLFLELPRSPRDFHQTVGRLDRDGQTESVQVKIAVATGTVQVKLLFDMLSKDELVGRVQPNFHDLRAIMFGGDDN